MMEKERRDIYIVSATSWLTTTHRVTIDGVAIKNIMMILVLITIIRCSPPRPLVSLRLSLLHIPCEP